MYLSGRVNIETKSHHTLDALRKLLRVVVREAGGQEGGVVQQHGEVLESRIAVHRHEDKSADVTDYRTLIPTE